MTLTEQKEKEEMEKEIKEMEKEIKEMAQARKGQAEMKQAAKAQAAKPLTSKKRRCLFVSAMRHSLPMATWW